MRFRIATALATIFITLNAFAQPEGQRSYDLRFLAAKYIDSTSIPEILLIFKYEPHAGKEFKPIFSMKIGYRFEGDTAWTTELVNKAGHSISFYGEDIREKSPFVYELIRQKISNNADSRYGFVVFTLRNLQSSYVPHMQFSYGLWEPENTELRFEDLYEVSIDR